jgi:cell division septum initiation protein DivIVA
MAAAQPEAEPSSFQRELGEISATLKHILERQTAIEQRISGLERELHGRMSSQGKRLEGLEKETAIEDARHKGRARLHGLVLAVFGMTGGALLLRIWQWLTTGGPP